MLDFGYSKRLEKLQREGKQTIILEYGEYLELKNKVELFDSLNDNPAIRPTIELLITILKEDII